MQNTIALSFRCYFRLSFFAIALLVVGCARDAYYGVTASNQASSATLLPWARTGNIASYTLFFVTHVDGGAIPVSQNTGTGGLKLRLSPARHVVRLTASHPTLINQAVATADITFTPQTAKEYVPAGKLEGQQMSLWIAERQTGERVSPIVIAGTQKAAPIPPLDIAPLIMTAMPW